MTDIARMQFQSAKKPNEKGWLAIDEGGNLRVEPSEEMIEELALIEQNAVEMSQKATKVAVAILFGLGALAAVAGWLVGRYAGRVRDIVTSPRDISRVDLKYDPAKGIQLRYPDSKIRFVILGWERGEYNSDEAEEFVRAFDRLKADSENA